MLIFDSYLCLIKKIFDIQGMLMVNFYYIFNLRLIYFSYLTLISFAIQQRWRWFLFYFCPLTICSFSVCIYSIIVTIEILVATYKSKNEKDIRFFLCNKKKITICIFIYIYIYINFCIYLCHIYNKYINTR